MRVKCKATAVGVFVVLAVSLGTMAPAAGTDATTDTLMGEYIGIRPRPEGPALKVEAKVFPQFFKGEGTYGVVVTLASGKPEGPPTEARFAAKQEGQTLPLSWKINEVEWTGVLKDRRITAEAKGTGKMRLEYTVRHSPTEGQKPPEGAVVLLGFEPGQKPSLDEWTNKKWVPLDDGSVMVRGGSGRTVKEFGDCRLHVEFMTPYEPKAQGQGRGNSGVYLQNRYEVQVLDSFGLAPRIDDCGAIYEVAVPKVNASLPPLQWQTYDITFRAPRVGDESKITQKATFVKVLHNGVLIQENVEVPGPTRAAGAAGHTPRGPIMLQDHGNPVCYRNIWLIDLGKEAEQK